MSTLLHEDWNIPRSAQLTGVDSVAGGFGTFHGLFNSPMSTLLQEGLERSTVRSTHRCRLCCRRVWNVPRSAQLTDVNSVAGWFGTFHGLLNSPMLTLLQEGLERSMVCSTHRCRLCCRRVWNVPWSAQLTDVDSVAGGFGTFHGLLNSLMSTLLQEGLERSTVCSTHRCRLHCRMVWNVPRFAQLIDVDCYRRVWNVPRSAQRVHPLRHVLLLWPLCPRSALPEVPLVEEVHDHAANCEHHCAAYVCTACTAVCLYRRVSVVCTTMYVCHRVSTAIRLLCCVCRYRHESVPPCLYRHESVPRFASTAVHLYHHVSVILCVCTTVCMYRCVYLILCLYCGVCTVVLPSCYRRASVQPCVY